MYTWLYTRRIMVGLAAALIIFSAACSGEVEPVAATTEATTTTTEIPDLEFGNGEVPFTVPGLFPIPDSGVVGSTMINGAGGSTEMLINFPANVADVVAFYETNLPVLGFTVTVSSGTDSEWDITHIKDDVSGTINLKFGGSGLTSGIFTFEHN